MQVFIGPEAYLMLENGVFWPLEAVFDKKVQSDKIGKFSFKSLLGVFCTLHLCTFAPLRSKLLLLEPFFNS